MTYIIIHYKYNFWALECNDWYSSDNSLYNKKINITLQVQKDKDKTIELEFNRLLDSVSHLAHQLHVDQVHRKPLSLGKSLESVMR